MCTDREPPLNKLSFKWAIVPSVILFGVCLSVCTSGSLDNHDKMAASDKVTIILLVTKLVGPTGSKQETNAHKVA